MSTVICPTCGAACSLGGETTRYFIPPKDESKRIADLERQLAEKQAEIAKLRQIMRDDCDAESDWITVAGEWDKSDRYCVESAATVMERMKAEIEAMQPMIEACRARYERHNLIAKGYPTETEEIDPCQCLTCQWYRDYLERKQP